MRLREGPCQAGGRAGALAGASAGRGSSVYRAVGARRSKTVEAAQGGRPERVRVSAERPVSQCKV